MSARGVGEIASDVELVSGSWTVVIGTAERVNDIEQELRDELELIFAEGGGKVTTVDAAQGMDAVVSVLRQGRSEDVVLIGNTESLDARGMHQLDGARTFFEGGPRVVMVMTESTLARLAEDAPHLWSWVSARVFTVDHQLGTLDIEARLASLREGTGMTDEEVLQRARAGELPRDPVFAEWLILLGKGELLGA